MTNFELGCLAVALVMILPELCDVIRKLSEEK